MQSSTFSSLAALVVGSFIIQATLTADEPTIALLTPPGMQRGTEAEISISGARLADTTKLLLYQPGIEVIELITDGENKVKARLKAAADCPPGLHALRLATETGISNLRYFGISPLPQVDEIEPNNDFSAPQLLTLNTTVNGVVKSEDVDYYAIDLEEGQIVTVELDGLRLGTEFYDPTVAILDDKRFELVSSDDAALLQQDCVCSLKAPKAGHYTIEVRESSYGGNDRCQYRLHVGDFPRPLVIVPGGGRPGELLQATLIDSLGETWTENIQLPSLEAVDAPVAFNGILKVRGEIDRFKIRGKKDQQLEFNVYGRRILRSPIDSWLEIHKSAGGRLASNDDAGGPDSQLSFKLPEDGEYLLAIRDQLNDGGPTHAYRLEVAPPQPSVKLTIDELVRYFSQTVEVPQGAHMAVLLRVSRANFSGDLGLRLEDAPEGLELITPTIAANQTYIPMLIRAKADAPIDAGLAKLVAETPPDGAGIKGTLDQRTMLVRGQNNRDMWGHNSQHLAVAVTKALPFTISLTQPQVPIVRNGQSHYIVTATRKEGFKEPIFLRSLYNPPGCSASGSIRIEPDKTQALIPVTANGSAGIGAYPITVLARALTLPADVEYAPPVVQGNYIDQLVAEKLKKKSSAFCPVVNAQMKSFCDG